MDIQEITLLVVQRYKAMLQHKEASKQYIQDMTDDEILKLKPIHLKALKTMDELENV